MMVVPIISSTPMSVRSGTGSRHTSQRMSSSLTRSIGCPSPSLTERESLEQFSWKMSPGFRSSNGRRSNLAASPEATSSSQIVSAAPLAQISGFQVNCPSSAALPDFPQSPRKQRGGLAMALSTNLEEEGISPLCENVFSNFFPEVDLTGLEAAQTRHPVFKTEVVSTAYMLASRAYKGENRLHGTSQLSHCLIVAKTLADLGLDQDTVAAGLLHEVLRHSDVFRAQLEEFMPKQVVQLVDRVTTMSKISQLHRNHRDEISDERLQDMLVAMEDVKAVIIKLACRLHNMKTVANLPIEKQRVLAQETLDIYSVVANRLGVWHLKAELEDAAFAVLHPEEYDMLRNQAAARQEPELLETTINSIKAAMDAAGVEYVDISGRPKNLYGIWRKMKADCMTSLNQVYDVTALRVVVCDKHDCYRAQRVVQRVYRCMASRSKDFIKVIKKPNGYQSLHETAIGAGDMPVEVQIRTHKMHYIAEYGFAAHWKYKENLNNEDTWLDKEVQYKKWLTTYKLGVHDKKVRPSGSPPTDSSLKALGMHLIDTTGPKTLPSGSPPPHASPDVDPFLRHERFKLEQPSRTSVSVVVQTDAGVKARDFPSGMTAQQLGRELSVTSLAGYALTVNQRLLPHGEDLALQSGDLVQVLPLSQALSRSPPEERAKHMDQLNIFHLGVKSNVMPLKTGSLLRGVPSFQGFFPVSSSVAAVAP